MGEGEQKSVSEYQEWKQKALAEFAKGDAELQTLMKNERAKGREAPGLESLELS